MEPESQDLRASFLNCEGSVRRTLERLPAYFVDLLLEYMSRNGGRGRQINPSCPINGILVGRFRVAVAFQILGQQDPEIVLFVLKPRELEGAVKILAETRDHRYGGLLEYRRTAKGWKRSLPTGKITLAIKNSAVEMSVVSAFAEILEEVGFVGDEHSEAKIIGESDWEADLIQNGSVVTVLVRGLDGAAEMSPDPDEEIVPELLTLSSLFAFATTKFNPACPSQPAQARDPSLLAVAAMLASLAKDRKEDPEYLDRELHLISEMLDGTPSFSSDGEPISGDPEDDEYSRTPWFNSEDPRNR